MNVPICDQQPSMIGRREFGAPRIPLPPSALYLRSALGAAAAGGYTGAVRKVLGMVARDSSVVAIPANHWSGALAHAAFGGARSHRGRTPWRRRGPEP